MEALHLSRIRSSTNSSIKSSRSRALKINTQRSVVPQIKDVLPSMSTTNGSNYKSASVEEADMLDSGDETFMSESTVAVQDDREEFNSQSLLDVNSSIPYPSGSRMKFTTRISRASDGNITVTGAMNFSGSSLFSPENAELLSRIPSGVYEQIGIAESGITLTENGVKTFVPRCLERTFEDSVPIRRSTPYSLAFKKSTSPGHPRMEPPQTSTKIKAASAESKKMDSDSRAESTRNTCLANDSIASPSGTEENLTFKKLALSQKNLPNGATFIKCQFSGCSGEYVVLRDCSFARCRFANCTILGGSFSDSELQGCDLTGCFFSRSDVRRGTITGCTHFESKLR